MDGDDRGLEKPMSAGLEKKEESKNAWRLTPAGAFCEAGGGGGRLFEVMVIVSCSDGSDGGRNGAPVTKAEQIADNAPGEYFCTFLIQEKSPLEPAVGRRRRLDGN